MSKPQWTGRGYDNVVDLRVTTALHWYETASAQVQLEDYSSWSLKNLEKAARNLRNAVLSSKRWLGKGAAAKYQRKATR
jgi:hypothetical protein